MQIIGKVVDVEFDIEIQKNGGGTYEGTTLTYKAKDGKVNSKSWVKKVLDHPANAHVKAQLQTLTKGTEFTAEAVKNDAGFWNWTDIKIGAANTATASNTASGGAKSNSTYATPEERAERFALDKAKFEFEKDKQGLIIKQSSLSNAIAYLDISDIDVGVEHVISIAKQFEAYVLGCEE